MSILDETMTKTPLKVDQNECSVANKQINSQLFHSYEHFILEMKMLDSKLLLQIYSCSLILLLKHSNRPQVYMGYLPTSADRNFRMYQILSHTAIPICRRRQITHA